MDLKTMSLQELKKLARQLETEITRRVEYTKKDLLKGFQKQALSEGLSLDDILGAPAREPAKRTYKKKGTKAPAKAPQPFVYFNPEDPKKGWSGYGRKPNWYLAWVEAGKDPEALKTPRAAAKDSGKK